MMAEEELRNEAMRPYRALSKAAVISLLLGLISIVGLALPPALGLAAIGLVLGLYALRSIRRYPDELTGRIPAVLGTIFCGVLLVGGVSLHSVIYATEVPEGYQRISFGMLQPVSDHPELPVPPAALELDGQRIFVKGYLYPDGQQSNIKRFVLIPDMGTCCFGGQPKLTDMIEVTLEDPLRAEFARRKRRLGGILKVDTDLKPVSGLTGVYYQLEADYYK
jgi:hypothetical protein